MFELNFFYFNYMDSVVKITNVFFETNFNFGIKDTTP